MKNCIFIRSYQKDFEWLKYCLRSIEKFCRGFDEVLIAVPEKDLAEIQTWNLTKERIVPVKEHGADGYLDQQICKIYADTLTDADVFYFVDSDCCFNVVNRPEDFYTERKLRMLITPYKALGDAVPWQKITEKALKIECPFETMRRLPFVFPADLLAPFRAYMEAIHKKRVEEYVMEQPHRAFSEFNAIGSYAWFFHRKRFFWWNTEESQNLPQTVLHQSWSWGGIQPEIKEKLEALTAP